MLKLISLMMRRNMKMLQVKTQKNAEEIKTEVPEHKEDQDKDRETITGTIEDPAISIAAKEVVDSVTAKAVEKVAAIAKAEDEEKQSKKKAALEDPKIISAARKVVDQATSDAVEKVAAMQAGHPAVVIGEPNEQTVDPVQGEHKDVAGVFEVKELLQGEIPEEVVPADNRGQKTDRITFTLNSAKDLVNTDYIGKSDPYARISFGSFVCRTSTKKNDLSPQWNHLITLNVDGNSPSSIDVELFDEDTLGQDKSLGRISIDVSEIKSSLITTRASRKLKGCDSGEITYSARFTTATELPEDSTSEEPETLLVTSDLGIERTSFKQPSDTQAQVQEGKTDFMSRSTSTSSTKVETKIESQEGSQSISSQSTETQKSKVEFASKKESSTSEFIQKQTEDVTSFAETSTRKVSKLSQESCRIESQSIETQDNKVEFASKQESSTSEIIEKQTVDETRPDGEIEDDLERKKENQPENQASGIEETQRLLLGEQMEEKYPAPGVKDKGDPKIQFDLERKKEKKPENQASGIEETQRVLQGERRKRNQRTRPQELRRH